MTRPADSIIANTRATRLAGRMVLLPTAIILLLAACAPMAPWDDSSAFPSASTPTAGDLIARAMELMGGREAIARIDVLTTVADCDGPPGAFTTTVHAAGGQRVVFQQADAGGAFIGHVNGDIGWMADLGTGAVVPVEGDMRSMFLGHAFHHLALHLDGAFRDHELVGRSLFGDRLCWKVRMIDAFDRQAWAYFGVDDGRLDGMTLTVDAGGDAAQTVMILYDDWRVAGDLRLFHAFALRHGPELWRYRFTDIRINEQDPAIFEVPAAVRELLGATPEPIAGDR
jgi:hypothetical protein